MVDRDGNGLLELAEFRAALTRLGLGLSHTVFHENVHALSCKGCGNYPWCLQFQSKVDVTDVLARQEVEQLVHAMNTHGHSKIEYAGFCNALHAGKLPVIMPEPEPEPEPEVEEQQGTGVAAAAALMGGGLTMQRKKAAAKAKMGPVEAARCDFHSNFRSPRSRPP
jgi:hypothetical protein